MTTKEQLAKAIVDMNYGTLIEVATDLSNMIDEDVRPEVKTTQDFAELLFDWAKSFEA